MQWGAEEDAKLFMYVLSLNSISPDHQALAMAMGNDCTAKAVAHRIEKLRFIATGKSTAATSAAPGLPISTPKKRAPRTDSADTTTTTAPSSPKSTKEPPPARFGKPMGKARGKGSPLRNEVKFVDGESEDEDAVIETPSKKKVKFDDLPSGNFHFYLPVDDDVEVDFEAV